MQRGRIVSIRRPLRKISISFGKYLLLIAWIGAIIFPFMWMISISLKPETEIFSIKPLLVPKRVSIEHYRYVVGRTNFLRFFLNSLIVAAPVAAITMLITSFSAYAISRFAFPGRKASLALILSQQMFPSVLLLIPIFIILRRLGLVNTYAGLILLHITLTIPFTMLMLIGYFDSIPVELEEAALIDGCTRLGIIFRIVLPLSAPCIAAAATFAFMVSWHEYIFALTISRSELMRTLPVGLSMFQDMHRILWGPVMAGSVLTVLPAIILFFFLQKLITEGLVSGAIKQ